MSIPGYIRRHRKTRSAPAPQTPPIVPIALPRALEDERLTRAGIRLPKVSFIVTSFNYERYIVDCLRAVARQTYPHWECVIIDDCSTDTTVARVREFLDTSEAGDRFRLIRRQENGGQMEAFRDGLAATDGAFVVMLDADDVLLEDYLHAHMQAHTAVRTVAFTSSNQYQIDSAGQLVGGEHMDHQSKGHFRHIRSTCFQDGFWIWATSSSMVFRRSTVELIMPRDNTTFRICADYYIAHFCHLIGDSLLIPTVHGCYRRHGGNNFGSNLVMGQINSVGNLDKHPPHDLFRTTMIRHILDNQDMFYPIFMGPGLQGLLMRLLKQEEVGGMVSRYPDVFKGGLKHNLELHKWRHHQKMTTPITEKFKMIAVQPDRTAHNS